MQTRKYQESLIETVAHHLHESNGCVAAGAPGVGKTYVGERLVTAHLQEHPNAHVLWLAHGQNGLKNQTVERLAARPHPFSYSSLGADAVHIEPNSTVVLPGSNVNANLHVALPHQFVHKESGRYSMIVVDEAHHFVEGSMFGKIRKANPTAKLLFLTGTPSKYLASKEMPVACVSIQEVELENPKVYSDLHSELVQTSADLSFEDWDPSGKLMPESVDSDTEESLQGVVDALTARFTSKVRDPALYANNFVKWFHGSSIGKWFVNGHIGPTLWACHDQRQASLVQSRLTELGIPSRLSTSDTDKDSEQLDAFRSNPEGVLLVVDRGVLGMDVPALKNVVDMTGSHNVDIVFQLLCRGIRYDKTDPDAVKLFLKVTPRRVAYWTEIVLSYVLAMGTKEVYESPHGKIPSGKFRVTRGTVERGEAIREARKAGTSEPKLDLPVFFRLKQLCHLDSAPAESIGYGSFAYAFECMGRRQYHTHTLESCRESALQYNTRKGWQKGDVSSYSAACKRGWLSDCCQHMVAQLHTHSLESCKQSASKFSTRGEWSKGDGPSYDAARRRGWLSDCCQHMAQCRTHTLESCRESALQYNTRKGWQKGDVSSYSAACKRGWVEDCCQHMVAQCRTHTLESCKESASKFSTRKEWSKGDAPSYLAACRRGWVEDCCQHMVAQRHTHTLESCRESALQYSTRKEWKKGDGPSYLAACRRGWVEDCCQHMVAQDVIPLTPSKLRGIPRIQEVVHADDDEDSLLFLTLGPTHTGPVVLLTTAPTDFVESNKGGTSCSPAECHK